VKEGTMTEEHTSILGALNNVILIDDERIKGHLDRVMRGTIEEALSSLLDAERASSRGSARSGRRGCRDAPRSARSAAHAQPVRLNSAPAVFANSVSEEDIANDDDVAAQ
jgi:hypothetical protein